MNETVVDLICESLLLVLLILIIAMTIWHKKKLNDIEKRLGNKPYKKVDWGLRMPFLPLIAVGAVLYVFGTQFRHFSVTIEAVSAALGIIAIYLAFLGTVKSVITFNKRQKKWLSGQ